MNNKASLSSEKNSHEYLSDFARLVLNLEQYVFHQFSRENIFVNLSSYNSKPNKVLNGFSSLYSPTAEITFFFVAE
ncbi:MAG: hypothetical protein ACTSSF_11850 [Candidatus Heimdallarchaeaceae archaeon]